MGAAIWFFFSLRIGEARWCSRWHAVSMQRRSEVHTLYIIACHNRLPEGLQLQKYQSLYRRLTRQVYRIAAGLPKCTAKLIDDIEDDSRCSRMLLFYGQTSVSKPSPQCRSFFNTDANAETVPSCVARRLQRVGQCHTKRCEVIRLPQSGVFGWLSHICAVACRRHS